MSSQQKKPISVHIAKLGFGKLYAHELCVRAGINPQTETLSEEEQAALYAAYQSILDDSSGAHVYSDGEITPFMLKKKQEDGECFGSFSQAIDSVHQAKPAVKDRAQALYMKERQRVQKLINMQEASANKNETEAALHQQKGEHVYEKYQELKKLLEELQGLMEKHSLQDIKKKLEDHDVIKEINPKTGDLVVEVAE